MTFPVLSANGPSGYNLTRSLRFRSSASAYLNRTPASATNQKTWTWSGWVKLGSLGNPANIFGTRYVASGPSSTLIRFANNNVDIVQYTTGSLVWNLVYTPVYRDFSAWYHIVVAMDTTQATSTNRLKLYINGVQVTATTTASYPAQNNDTYINSTNIHTMGVLLYGDGTPTPIQLLDGYMTEVNFVDGQALTPSSFGSTNSTTGVWQPSAYTGTYGTNGFYLPFTDNSALTTASNAGLGKDFSGNANYWVTNNISITAGATYDSMTDVPTLTSATAANYCVGSPLNYRTTTPTPTITDGNLSWIGPSASLSSIGCATFGGASGKFYWEATRVGTNTGFIGVVNGQFNATTSSAFDLGYNSNEYAYISSGNKVNNNSSVAYGASYTSGDVIGFALDLDAGTLTFYKNNTSQGVAYSGLSLGNYWLPAFDSYNGAGFTLNFGQRPFSYTPPSGFVALNTYNLPASTIPNGASYMAATLYTGTSGNVSVVDTVNGFGFQPDFLWVKARSNAQGHSLVDSVRGATSLLQSNSTAAQQTLTNPPVFTSNGFTSTTDIHTNGYTYVAWQWKGGGTAVSNTNGTITSSVSANTTSGCSVVTYTGNATANATVGHGLGVAPSMVIVKIRSSAGGWWTYHVSTGKDVYLDLSDTAASASSANYWGTTGPTSSTFQINGGGGVNNNGSTYVAYCFAAIKGFSAFGSYTGNGVDDGPFVYTGFRPRYVLIKRTDVADNWFIQDTSRNPSNIVNLQLKAQASDAEASTVFDIVSNGFKVRNSFSGYNTSAGTYIYAAFAENPFQNALAR